MLIYSVNIESIEIIINIGVTILLNSIYFYFSVIF